MEEQSSKSKSFIIVLVACILIILAIVICVIFFNKKDANVNEDEKNVGGTQTLYHIVDGEEATVIDADLAYNDTEGKTLISFDYPQFDIEGEEIAKINTEIKDAYQKAYNTNFGREISEETDFPLVIEKGGKYYCNSNNYTEETYCEFKALTYNISDTDKYLAISFEGRVHCHCGIGADHFGYVIDKETKKVLTNSEIVKLFNETEKSIIDEYNENVDKTGCLNDSDRAKTIDDITLYVENNELIYVNESCN